MSLAIYLATKTFPKEELYGLTSQMRRSAGAIAANIAEGCGRGTDKDFARFLQIAMGSACELECHLLLARDLKLLSAGDHQNLEPELKRVKQILSKLMLRVRADS